MTAPTTQPAGTARLHRLRSTIGSDWFAIALACLLALTVANVFLDDPERVDLEITNPTPYVLSIEITDGGRGAWQPTARLQPGATRTIEDVLDQGDVWVLRFRGQGRDGGELEVPGHDLERASWHVDIPAEVGERLAALGVSPSSSAPPAGSGS
jgi:hypothetical protein